MDKDKEIYLYRMFTTMAIWIAFAAIMIFVGWNLNVVLSGMLIIAAGISTKFVWDYHEDFSRNRGARMTRREIQKAKRESAVDASRLLAVLDEGERDEIMRRLSHEDGELVDLDKLANGH